MNSTENQTKEVQEPRDIMLVAAPGSEIRYTMSWLCLIAPLAVYYFFFLNVGLEYFFPPDLTKAVLGAGNMGITPVPLPTNFMDQTELFSEELLAREKVFISSVAVMVFAIAAAAWAFASIFRNREIDGLALAMYVSLLFAILAAARHGNKVREAVVEWPLELATNAEVTHGLEKMHEGMALMSKSLSFFVVIAASALVIRLSELTLGNGKWDGCADIYMRGRTLREILLVGSVLLCLATIATYFYFHYPLEFMSGRYAEAHERIAQVASFRWGLLYSMIMLTAAAPAIAVHLMERERLERDLTAALVTAELEKKQQTKEGSTAEREEPAEKSKAEQAKEEMERSLVLHSSQPPFITLNTLAAFGRAFIALGAIIAPALVLPLIEAFSGVATGNPIPPTTVDPTTATTSAPTHK